MLLLLKLYKTTGESRKSIDKTHADYSFKRRVSRESFAHLKKYELQRAMPNVFGCLDDILHNGSSNMPKTLTSITQQTFENYEEVLEEEFHMNCQNSMLDTVSLHFVKYFPFDEP